MASSDEKPGPMPGPEGSTPGKAMTTGQRILDKGAQIVQSLKPIKHISQHACTFAFYAHDLSRHIQTHHFLSRLNQDFLQCPVYDSDSSDARLIGIEYIISEWIFEALPAEEQKLWHSHAYEIESGLWINPGMAETIQKLELRNLAKTYGKFWCTWQVDRGDKLPLGAPALMVSPQAEIMGLVNPELIVKRDEKYRITSEDVIESRAGIEEPETISLHADHWRNTGKGFAIDVVQTEMKSGAPFP
ncbi:hypothetical protein Nepgr_007034 [Nepenthes gracilis]|uniref:Oil body-associated protein 2B n=1 Tax=Nepenthes gracilis TaxID=150966 RepID=A0AAD3S6B7_NEPGR|nr:hypothetical protein Nepgr_007034 [Nepenthes gracilis]